MDVPYFSILVSTCAAIAAVALISGQRRALLNVEREK